MTTILVVAPHPDDETLGCGGTLLRHRATGDRVHWLIATAMAPDQGFSPERIAARDLEIKAVAASYGFAGVHRLDLPTCQLDAMGLGEIVSLAARVVAEVSPEVVYLPFRGDAHSDHRVVFDAVAACLKWFRAPGVRRVLAYETLSETGFNLTVEGSGFHPNVYVDISDHFATKIAIMQHYAGEMDEAPFPRSAAVMEAQAVLNGAHCGCSAAERFMLLKELI